MLNTRALPTRDLLNLGQAVLYVSPEKSTRLVFKDRTAVLFLPCRVPTHTSTRLPARGTAKGWNLNATQAPPESTASSTSVTPANPGPA